ncbi:female sterile (1) Nasrat [Leptinotarsa decemlineata]|uniref:female sterile (1) Nasrat n=1 Tax=Leptinotarsa decemlineata TaxID=7539 RepID=UPI003D3057B6
MLQIVRLCFLLIFSFYLCQCFEDAWYSYQNSVKNANREELVIKNITAERNYTVERNVTRWKSLTIGPTCYSVGLFDTGLNILITDLDRNRTGFDIDGPGEIDLKDEPSDVIIFQNRINGQSEAVLVVSFAQNSNLLWIRLTPDKMEIDFWSWTLEEPIVHINTINMKGRQIMLVVSANTRANLYEFDIKTENKSYWYLQSLHLKSLAKSSAFSSLDSEYFLAIPQTSMDSVSIYKYEKSHFVEHDSIRSPKVTAVVSFTIGFKSFLAVDGYNSAIYEFTKNGLIERKIVNSNSETIHYWLPVPIQTYRDEVIVFAQRYLDHGTHKTYAVEIITYNGGQFEEHEDVPCSSFEETSPWLICLAHDNGIVGASYMAIGNKLALIVSKPSKSSFVTFMIHSTMKLMPHPKKREIDLLYEQKHNLQKLIDEIIPDLTDSLNTEEYIVGEPEEDITKFEKDILSMGLNLDEAMKKVTEIKSKENQTEYDTIIVNGAMKVQNNFTVDRVEIDEINNQPATDLLRDIVRKDELNEPLKNKTFTDLEVENLNFEVVNNINASQITYSDDDDIVLRGNITIEGPAKLNKTTVTTGKINDMDITGDFLKNGMKANTMSNLKTVKRNITAHMDEDKNDAESAFISQNISVININGIPFSEFIANLCLVNVKCYIPGNLTIIGNTTVNELNTSYLNDLMFPEEYILADSVFYANITGRKKFVGSLGAIAVRSEGNIGGVDTDEIFTLSTDQIIPGKFTFKNLELTEELNVTGKVLGEHVSEFVTNPTLKETDLIKSNVDFRRLEVRGNITLDNEFSGEHFGSLLDDFVYLSEEITNVTGYKTFSKGLTVKGNLEIESNSINNVNLETLVTKDSEQKLDMNFLNGAVTIGNLRVNGTYDGIDIAQLDESLVKLTGEQFLASTLIFTDDVTVENLEITGKLNELEHTEYLYTDGDMKMPNNVAFDRILVENLHVQGNFTGNFSNLDLADFSRRYLSFTKNQTVAAQFHIGSSDVDNLFADDVNGQVFGKLFNETWFLDTVRQMLNNGTSKVENLKVDDSIHIKTVNNINIDDIISTGPLKTENGTIRQNLTFQNDIYFNELEIDKLSSVGWNEFVEAIVFKNETTLNISGTKRFKNGIEVDKLVDTKKINGIAVSNILTKEGSQHIDGPIIINGNVTFDNSSLFGSINKTPFEDIAGIMNVSKDLYTVKDDMVFRRVAHIKHLIVNGTVNEKIPDQILKTIVHKNSDAVFENKIIFKKPVNISGKFDLISMNNENFNDKISNVVLTTSDVDISGRVSFSKPTIIQNQMRVDNDFDSNLLFGLNTDDWLDKAIFLDKGFIGGNFSFEEISVNEELLTDFINDINMTNIIPLRSNQSIDYLVVEEVRPTNNINVGHWVNGFKLPQAFENTMMGNVDQEIESDILFESNILVRQLLSSPTINDKNASKIVTIHTDQNLTSPITFKSKCNLESDLEVHGLINDINLKLWKKDKLRLFSNTSQDVMDVWNIRKNLSFINDVAGNSSIGGLDLANLAKEVDERREYKYKFEKGIIDDYTNICTDVTYLYEKTKSQIYKFKYFDDFQQLSFQNNIKHVFYFEYQNSNYLLVNENNCISHVFAFNGTVFHPLIENIKTGSIEQVVPVYDENDIYLVIRGVEEGKCNVVGTNIWKFTDKNLDMVMNMESQILLQESLIPATFYAINADGVIEYKVKRNFAGYKKYRKWDIIEENVAFMPRGLKTGLALRTGSKIIYLDQSDPIIEDEVDNNIEVTIRGEFRSVDNEFIPGKNGSDLVVMNVGMKSARKNLLAIATHEETIIKARLDFVKIYRDGIKGELFDKVPTYKASSLLSIEFDQGETLLVFLENKRLLRVYEYKGIEGFKHRTSVKLPGSKLFQMTLPIDSSTNTKKTIGVIYKNKIRVLEAVMDGNFIKEDLKCGL